MCEMLLTIKYLCLTCYHNLKFGYFRAAFFDSFINKPLGKLFFLKRNHNIETWTAINTNGVTVIDREKDVGVTSILPTYMYEKGRLKY